MGFVRIAGGKCSNLSQCPPARMDIAKHRQYEGADEASRVRVRLVAGSHDLFSRLLPLEPVVLRQALRARPGLSQKEQGELVSEVLHRIGERAGSIEWMLLAA